MSFDLEEKFPNFHQLLLCYTGEESNDDAFVLNCYFDLFENDVASMKDCIVEIDLALKENPFPWEEIRRLTNLFPPGKGKDSGEAEYRAWMQDVLRQMEERFAAINSGNS